MSPRALLNARLQRSLLLSDRTKHLEFEVEGADRFDFIAGQFVSMTATKPDGKAITRAYSIASAPQSNARFDVCLNRVDGGFFSNYLCDLEEGAVVTFHGPHGHFILRNPVRDSIFIATGTGIAPMRAFLNWIYADSSRHQGHDFYLVFGSRYEQDIYYH